MDSISRPYYELAFENKYLRLKGIEFQNFFSQIMETRYPNDFIPIRPWGKYGDRKNDGYLSSEQVVHQVYAPNNMSASEAIRKIDEDFNGALAYWNGKMKTWIFVHNSYDGLSSEITNKLEDLKQIHSSIKISHIGRAELRNIIFSLSDQDIAPILGPAPTETALKNIQFEDLKIVISSIKGQNPTLYVDLRPVPQNKITSNKLSEDVKTLIISGMRKSHLVEVFFNDWHDPTLGDGIAESFKTHYLRLKEAKLAPDDIYMELIRFAGGSEIGSASHSAAVLAIVSYFFEQCDIFERYDEGEV